MHYRFYQSGPDDPLVRAFSYPYEQAAIDGALDLRSGALRGLAGLSVRAAPDTRLAGIGGPVPCCRIETADVPFDEPRHLLLAGGSNASPTQLMRKFHGREETHPIVLLAVSVPDLIAVHSAHVTAYGAVAGTLMAWPGTSSRLTLLAVTGAQLRRINETESLGRNYHLAALPAGVVPTLPACGVLMYRSIRGVFAPNATPLRLKAFNIAGGAPPAVSQQQALDAAARALDLQGPREAFVARLIEDAAFRQAATEAMARLTIEDGLAAARTLAVRA